MNEKFLAIKEKAEQQILACSSTRELGELKAKYLGKTGEITALLKEMRNIAPEERANFGKLVNDLKEQVTEIFFAREKELKEEELKAQYKKEAVDITLPGKKQKSGSLHPLSIVKNEIISAFAGMGFEIFEGPEIVSKP